MDSSHIYEGRSATWYFDDLAGPALDGQVTITRHTYSLVGTAYPNLA